MENAAKALAIAAGVVFSLIIISLLLVLYNRLSTYYDKKSKIAEVEQIQEFNAKFENYNGKQIRGNELISIMNSIIDYNNLQADIQGYQPIGLTIELLDHQNELRYDNESITDSIITDQSFISNDNGNDDSTIKRIAEISATLSSSLGITDIQLQKLSAQIANIVDENDQDSNYKDEYRIYRAQILTRILREKIEKDTDVTEIESATYKYYQVTQFKRAMFECTEVTYDTLTGRVNGMAFEVILEDGNDGKTIKFD